MTGTAGYMSPEQASGGTVDARSDVFSFGLLLYEMVTGRRAFGGSSSVEAMAAVLKDQPKPPSELAPGIPRDLERIILRCLRKDPGRRFQLMADVKVELLEVKEESDSQASAPAGPAAIARRSHRRRLAWTTLGIGLALAAATALAWRARRPDAPPPTVMALTSERKSFGASFSPDGTQIAFASAGEDGANWDIWLKIVGEAEARRLTTDSASEQYPAWSPDGAQIAFLRCAHLRASHMATFWDTGAVHLVSPLGGTARRLSDFPARLQLSWSPDGRWLAAAKGAAGSAAAGGIHLVSVATGESRALTVPKAPAVDVNPALSPDGRALAYAACAGAENSPACDISVLPLDSELRPRGVPRLLTAQRLWNQGVSWARDGRSIVYSAGGGPHLWRVRADGSAPPERVEPAGRGASVPTVAAGRDRLAFSRRLWDPDIYVLRPGRPPAPIAQSTFADFAPQYSPDGRRIAFQSDRAADAAEIWLVDADGSNPTRITRGPGRGQGRPSWSPDGTWIAFDSQAGDGHADVWAIRIDGSGLRQVTHDPADETLPSWSRDGRLLYFVSNRRGRNEIWRVDVGSGSEAQVSAEGGNGPLVESLDGQTLYYTRARGGAPWQTVSDTALVTRPKAGGEERTILPCVDGENYTVDSRGILYFACAGSRGDSGSARVLRHRDSATGQDRLVASVEATYLAGLSVSPDGRTILYGHSTWGTADLMMIENFR